MPQLQRVLAPTLAPALALALAGSAALATPAAAATGIRAAAAAPSASQAAPARQTVGDVVAKPGSVGAIVASVDLALRASEVRHHGRALRQGAAAVYFGPETTARLKAFQQRNKLPVTGVVDEATERLLRPRLRLTRGVQTIGRSVQGRPLTVRVVGDLATAERRVVVFGCVHGNECEGVPILDAIARSTPPRGVAYVLFAHPNPDGAAAGTRHNAHGVDLNRNSIGWVKRYRPGHVYYPGPGALSEPESVTIRDLVRSVEPTAFVTYHQALRCIDYAGRGGPWAKVYSRATGLPVTVLPAYPGSTATWLGTRYPSIVSLTVELPRPVSRALLDRNIAALKDVAARH